MARDKIEILTSLPVGHDPPDISERAVQPSPYLVAVVWTLFNRYPFLICSLINHQFQATTLPEPFFLVTRSITPNTHAAFILISSSLTSPTFTPKLTIPLPLCICATKSLHHFSTPFSCTKTLHSICITGRKAENHTPWVSGAFWTTK
ncbi:hypothetical protein E4T47_05502 [Aureobasidium subglaciale]|nr:hypothetical protein E4T47_05502 [Aureobasidium subglaciale]